MAAVRQAESIKKKHPLISGNHSMKPDTPVGGVQCKKANVPRKQSRQFQGAAKQPNQSSCGRCGKSPSHIRQKCPAREAVCHKCAKRGHFQSMCRSTAKVAEVH